MREQLEDPMQSKTQGHDGAQRREKGALAEGQSTARGRPNHSVAESQRTEKLALLPLKLLRFTDVRERTGLSRSTVWRLERRGAFPKHVKVSANIVAWLEEDVVEWIRSKARQLVA
jgi:prophage regulatory protein